MHLIKLNATESTNTFLKEYSRKNDTENYTVVSTLNQTKGRGQRHNSWYSEKGKNLTFSVLVRFDKFPLQSQFYISKLISIAVRTALVKFLPNNIVVKWPNDILADNKKIAGILIENTSQQGSLSQSIIGIGLNVNQESFSKDINAVSMKMLSAKEWDLDFLLSAIVDSIKSHMYFLKHQKFEEIDNEYLENLYRFNEYSNYLDIDENQFRGKIIGVSDIGRLQMQLESGSNKEFDIKELKFI